jgi:hypothetical protein
LPLQACKRSSKPLPVRRCAPEAEEVRTERLEHVLVTRAEAATDAVEGESLRQTGIDRRGHRESIGYVQWLENDRVMPAVTGRPPGLEVPDRHGIEMAFGLEPADWTPHLNDVRIKLEGAVDLGEARVFMADE